MTNWTKEELLTYILIWCENADFIENQDEIDLILTKINSVTYKKIRREFKKDNDQQYILKICSAFKRLNYSKSEIYSIFKQMKEMFDSDGEYDLLEQNLNRGLKHILC